MIVDSFYTFLAADAGIAALCQSIYPQTIPQNSAYPALTYELDNETRDQLMAEIGLLKSATFEVSAWDTNHLTSHTLADAVEAALAGYRGPFGSKTAEHIRLERKFELFESDTKLYRVSQQFFVAYY